jgi:hypothetical protein
MAASQEWSIGFARQADADFRTFELLQSQPIPECHKLQFLQMACEKLVKAHLCGTGTDPEAIQSSHAYISASLPVVLRQNAMHFNLKGPAAKKVLEAARHLAEEIELSSPSVDRGGRRPDNCEYPWEDEDGKLHLPLEWTFYPSRLLLEPSGRSVLKLIRGAIKRLVERSA